MKTSIDIPDTIMNELMGMTHARLKKEAILTAIYEYIQRRKNERLASMLGTFEDFMTGEELQKHRDTH